MATAAEATKLALSLDGTTSASHFDRTAFKVKRIFATLAPDGLSLNLKLTPDEQQLKTMMAPDAFVAIPNKWGEQGWTTVTLKAIGKDELGAALRMAWEHARPAPARR